MNDLMKTEFHYIVVESIQIFHKRTAVRNYNKELRME
jgi:hypothetical protein